MKALIIIFLFAAAAIGQQIPKKRLPPDESSPKIAEQPGGIWLPAEGQINVLFIFCQFPDDQYQPDNPLWKKNDSPQRMKDKSWIDENWTGNPTPFGMTDFFNEMSFGKLKFIGKMINVVAPHSRAEYLRQKKRSGNIHQEIIEMIDDKVNFEEFDNYTKVADFTITAKPDGRVDMILFVWRNIHLDLPADTANKTLQNLGFGWFGTTGISKMQVDNKARYIDGTSGVTVQDFFTKDAFRFSIHEFAHYLIGGNDFHNGYAFWALLNGYASRHFMVNSFERHRLGWIKIKDIPKGTGSTNVKLRDFITTGDAVRIEIDAKSNQYFYLENHQRISKWDEPSANPNEKGIYVLRRNFYSGDNKFMQLIPADGRYNWEVVGYEYPEYYKKGIPVFRRTNPDRKSGYLENEPIPFTYEGKKHEPFEVIFYPDSATGKPVENPPNRGDGRDAFRPDYKTVFSPWSNPSSIAYQNKPTGIGFFIKKMDNGVADLQVYTNSSAEGPPSKPDRPQLQASGNSVIISWIKNEEPDAAGYNVYMIDIFGSEKLIGKTDKNKVNYTYKGEEKNKKIRFRVSCYDEKGEESLKSENGEWIN